MALELAPGNQVPGFSKSIIVVNDLLRESMFGLISLIFDITISSGLVGEVIYVVKGNTAKETPVKTGLRKEGYIQILEGITLNDEIVKDGAGFLTDSSIIEIVN